MSDDGTRLEVEILTRSFPCAPGRRRTVVDQLRKLASAGQIDDLSVVTLPAESEYTSDSDAVSKFEELQQWGNREDATITPPFEVRHHHSEFTGEECELLVAPDLCLAVYENGRLTDVYPSERDGSLHTIEEFLLHLRLNDGKGAISGSAEAPVQ
jgi:hypothetical protein